MITIVGFLSRPHGYNALYAIIGNPNYHLLKVFTHKLKPKSEDIDRSERDDYSLFEQICGKNNIPLETIDSNSQIINNVPKCDFIVEISWRYLISKEIVKQASTLAFGVHRGKLPDYAGSEPIKQALEKNESEIVLSAHHLAEEIDSGGTISTITHLVNYENSKSLTQNIQRLRNEITPLFSKIVEITITKYQSISKEEK
jgi:methionyl-tRNA formyltransferase